MDYQPGGIDAHAHCHRFLEQVVTSTITRSLFDGRYSLYEAKEKGETVGGDIGYDALGDPTTDPGKILDGGAIRTFDRSTYLHSLAITATAESALRLTGTMQSIQPLASSGFG